MSMLSESDPSRHLKSADQDEECDHSDTISTASSSSFQAQNDPHSNRKYFDDHEESGQGQSPHSYPPLRPSKASNRSKAYEHSRSSYYFDLDFDESNDYGRDEEESAGLIEPSRTQPAKWHTPQKKCSFLSHLLPWFIILFIVTLLLLIVPFLGWLATVTKSTEDAPVSPVSDPHLTEVIIPDYWHMPEAPKSPSHFRKHKRPLPPGIGKLASFAGPFASNFVDLQNSSLQSKNKEPITMDEVMESYFRADHNRLDWSADDPDEGVFQGQDSSLNIVLEDVTYLRKESTGEGTVAKGGGKVMLVRATDVIDESGLPIAFVDFKISPDMRYVLLFSDKRSQWRYSSHSKVWLHDISSKRTTRLGSGRDSKGIAVASWSRKNHISFVEHNNLYIIRDPTKPAEFISVTNDGSQDVFNAIPDWVYEEEVFNTDSTYWWNPKGDKVAFLTFNETKVLVDRFPIYNPTNYANKPLVYPNETFMKYPKPGTPNPIVHAYIYDVQRDIKVELTASILQQQNAQSTFVQVHEADQALQHAGQERLITFVGWVDNEILVLRETNRWSDAARLVVFDTSKINPTSPLNGQVSRRDSIGKTGGWIPTQQDIIPCVSSTSSSAYVDVVSTPKGYRHISYFENATQSDPIFLTAGEWEVDKIVHVGNGRVYFTAGYPLPSVRHLFYVSIPRFASAVRPQTNPEALTNIRDPAWYEVNFDPKGNYYQLLYQGPRIPWSRVKSLRDPSFDLLLEDNKLLQDRVNKHVRPKREFYNITTPHGIVVSAEEIRPHDFDGSGITRYPVLINVYGGPNSQIVQAKWGMNDWSSYLACTLGYIVIRIDGRGTGFRGRKYRDVVAWNLGEAESEDVIGAAEQVRRLPYVAQSKVGLWGWSYGGYLTAKTIERDSGTFDLGMSVAPVTKWEFYDSIYTERYMKSPQANKKGYENAAVHVTHGFQNSSFLLAQGSGDDNVHFQNSAHLLDMLTAQHIRGFWFRMFTDSSHSISTRGAYRELHEFMTRFLVYNWGSGGKRRFRHQGEKDNVES